MAGKQLFSGYRLDQFADPEAFAVQLATLFERYDIEVVEYLTDIRNASCMQLRFKFPPSLQEVGETLVEETERRRRMRNAAQQFRPLPHVYLPIPNVAGSRANLFVPSEHPTCDALLAWSETEEADRRDYKLDPEGRHGLWVSLHIYETFYESPFLKTWRRPTQGEVRAKIGKAEIEARLT